MKEFKDKVNKKLSLPDKSSPYLLLKAVYPDYEWLPWKFTKSPSKLWDDPNNQFKFIKWAENQLKVEKVSDWYNIPYKVQNRQHKIQMYICRILKK